MSVRIAVLAAVITAAALPAAAQGWKVYRFDESGFAIQAPAQPSVVEGTFRTAAGRAVPSKTYRLAEPDIVYSMTVADFTAMPMDKDAAIAEAVKAFSAQGEVKLDVQARIDRQFGRELSVADKDGARSTVSVFYVGDRLYELEGRALAPDPSSGAGKAVRFQQSLEFINLGAERFRPENQPQGGGGGFRGRGGGGFGGGFGGRGGPPPQAALDACKGKAEGEAVAFTTRRGDLPATCRQTPQGLAARPNRPPPPPEAFEACKGKAAGDQVSFATPNGEVSGRCVQTPDGLAARPARGRGGPPDGAPPRPQ